VINLSLESETLPYPEEPVDESRTTANTSAGTVLEQWLTERKVPAGYHDFWKNQIVIHLYDCWPAEMLIGNLKADTPACTWSEGDTRHLASLAKWFNVGVIAHEQAHNSYALLSGFDRFMFGLTYNIVRHFSSSIKLLYTKNQYGLASTVEGHAELYRYLGEYMPAILKSYYPRLL
jgi:hypothetical protein